MLDSIARLLSITVYTDKLPPNVGGAANAFVVRIRPKYRDDAGIHAHELVHVMQFWAVSALAVIAIYAAIFLVQQSLGLVIQQPLGIAVLGFGLHSVLYDLVPAYRLRAEVQAYREQLRHYPDDRTELFAQYLAQNYRLAISPARAAQLLRGASNA
ncbi:MAG: hypothetical protein Q8R67_05080 [Rhodoferax sp.]|nr:hypothetical protein [Rhodoferax sp.]MDP3651039.1 hypothetical protein [Rhodoferax sp.]